MDITGVNRALNAPVPVASEVQPATAADTQSTIQAVKALNETQMFGHDNTLTFQRDPESKRMVMQVINRKTHEVVSQIPPEYVLRLVEDLKPQQNSACSGKVG